MQIASDAPTELESEPRLFERRLRLDGARIVELGCGRAQLTRVLASGGPGRELLALEVDTVQHALNEAITDLPNVRFALAGAQAIPADDASVDAVFMFKSLHHVPVEAMPQALREIRRVLRPGGHAWLSEPIYAGPFNEILRLFHDEGRVRAAAFAAVRAAVEAGEFELVEQLFFDAAMPFADFADFERTVIGVTHTRHVLSPAVHAEVERRFAAHCGADGVSFRAPMRVDLLRRPARAAA